MSAPTDVQVEHITREAQEIVNRELDRLEARLRSDARRFERMESTNDSAYLVEFLKAQAMAHDAASALIGRIRVMLAENASR